MAERFPRLRRGVRSSLRSNDSEPLALLVNLFDLAIVLVLALAVHIQAQTATGQRSAAEDARVPDTHRELPRYRQADGKSEGDGTRLGVAYQLSNGEVVFVPDATAAGR